jgi:hypothetical protein
MTAPLDTAAIRAYVETGEPYEGASLLALCDELDRLRDSEAARALKHTTGRTLESLVGDVCEAVAAYESAQEKPFGYALNNAPKVVPPSPVSVSAGGNASIAAEQAPMSAAGDIGSRNPHADSPAHRRGCWLCRTLAERNAEIARLRAQIDEMVRIHEGTIAVAQRHVQENSDERKRLRAELNAAGDALTDAILGLRTDSKEWTWTDIGRVERARDQARAAATEGA